MISIEEESIKGVENGDIIVKGGMNEIKYGRYEDGWCVVENLRDSKELEVERSGFLTTLSSSLNVKRKLPYIEFINDEWYILEAGELH